MLLHFPKFPDVADADIPLDLPWINPQVPSGQVYLRSCGL